VSGKGERMVQYVRTKQPNDYEKGHNKKDAKSLHPEKWGTARQLCGRRYEETGPAERGKKRRKIHGETPAMR